MHNQALFTRENSPKQFLTYMSMDFDVRRQQGMNFITEGGIILD